MPIMSKCCRRRSSLGLQLAVLLLIQLFVIWCVVGSRQSAFFDKLFGVDRQRVLKSFYTCDIFGYYYRASGQEDNEETAYRHGQ